MKKYDFHMHSHFSSDSEERLENIIDSALRSGLNGICLTDHNDFNYFSPEGESVFDLEYDEYVKTLNNLKENIRHSEIPLDFYIGTELGLGTEPEYLQKLADYDKNHNLDFIIGSTHVVNGIDPYYNNYWEGISDQRGVEKYFESIFNTISVVSNFDVYGHIDYIVRYIPNKYDRDGVCKLIPFDLATEIFKKLIESGKGIEINTAGLVKGDRTDYNPNRKLLKLYKELGGEIITTGSDAHVAGRVGDHIGEAMLLLKDCGFNYTTIFRNRKPEFIKID